MTAPPDLAAIFAQAVRAHQAGDLDRAERLYRDLLAQAPGRAEIHANLGALLQYRKRFAEAAAAFARAVALRPDFAEAHNNRGVTLAALGRHEEALACYRVAVALKPDFANAHNNLGVALRALDQRAAAAEAFARAAALRPDLHDIHYNLGLTLAEQGRPEDAARAFEQVVARQPRHAQALVRLAAALAETGRDDEALAAYARALALRPQEAGWWNDLGNLRLRRSDAEGAAEAYGRAVAQDPSLAAAWSNLGSAHRAMKREEESLAAFRRAVEAHPDFAEGWSNLGAALLGAGQLDEAARALERAIGLTPDLPSAWNNLGNVRTQQDRLDEAERIYRHVLTLAPDFGQLHSNLGNLLLRQRRLDEALVCYREAVRLAPDYAEGHVHLGMLLLMRGALAEGWAEFDWRARTPPLALVLAELACPVWDGQGDLEGRTLLLVGEQGHGDNLQFIRFAASFARLGARVVVRAHPALVRLLATAPGVAAAVAEGETVPEHDVLLPLLSAPRHLGIGLDTIPAESPYLYPDPAAAELWRRRLAVLPGLKVGLVWSGDPRPHDRGANLIDRRRSLPLAALAPLATVAGVSLIALQMGEPARQADHPPSGLILTQVMDEVADFADTAAIVANLDLVIAVDTSTAHLAGALGKPVWLLSRFDGCWRWLDHRARSPWYPAFRLYHQERPGAWEPVVARVAADLVRLVQDGETCP